MSTKNHIRALSETEKQTLLNALSVADSRALYSAIDESEVALNLLPE
jgi:hypothetical protein